MNVSSSLYRRYASARSYLAAHRKVGALGVAPDDLVVDVGSGQSPHPRANVLVDKFVLDSTERATHAGLRIDRPLIVADATETPFPDRAFDFAFCAHLLEHMTDPAALLDELQRIARAGYIETPSKVYEKLYGWAFHRWFVSVERNRLVLCAKDRPIFDGDLHAWFQRRLDQPRFWETFIPRLVENELLTVFVWRGEIAYQVIGEISEPPEEVEGFARARLAGERSELVVPTAASTLAQRLKLRVDRLRRQRSNVRLPRLLSSLECPMCRDTLEHRADRLICPRCGRTYPRQGDVYRMVNAEADTTAVGASGAA